MHTDAYDGPWNQSKAPILVINAENDPITPIWGAEAAVKELHNARLLKVDGDGPGSEQVGLRPRHGGCSDVRPSG